MIAGGGTGGHIFPGLALADAFRARDPKSEILFVGTERGLERKLVPEKGYPLSLIPIRRLKGESLLGRLRTFLGIPASLWHCQKLIRRFQPDLVVGVGGYSSGPVVLAASMLRRRVILLEQNSVAGLTNRILGRFADRIFTHFKESASYFKRQVSCLGNPVRQEILEQFKTTTKTSQLFTVLILGGSQGATPINKAVTEALSPLFRDKIRFLHQTGEKDYPWVKEAYRQGGFQAEVFPFIQEIGRYYKEADFVIARSGAMTVTELAACGRASLLIPYRFAADNHQQKNAEALVQAGAARILLNEEVTGKRIALILEEFLKNPELLQTMVAAAARLGRPNAGAKIVEEAYSIV
ncbi:MAG: undecaprenyldiphospho-muramoylpentapeptide beta-N-acetylglucosaminyltransferase [Deltaproteobacteria bacterium]|nr:undecaprenyldiphospho-muramoylpentapeptide beta-N-acetylglucosaminyltransferase [Deltaproteobacteria bacterium]